jgi:hypothetical protein
MPYYGGDVQGKTTILCRLIGANCGFVDIRAEFFHQDLQHLEIVQLGCSAQWHR